MTVLSIMIRTLASKATTDIWHGLRTRSLPPDIQDGARRKLRMLNNAGVLQDLRVPPNIRLDKLTGDRSRHFSMRINRQWRVCFRWVDGDAYDVDVVDYH